MITRLHFKNVQRDMENFYSCSIWIQLADLQPFVESTEIWKLTVLYFLRGRDDIQCRGPANLEFSEGATVHVECVASACKPPISLMWIQSNSSDIEETNTDENVSLTWRLTADKALHNQSVFCVATSDAFPRQNANCSVGPFSVLYPPSVQVTSSRLTFLPPVISEIKLSCNAIGHPTVHSYTDGLFNHRRTSPYLTQKVTTQLLPCWKRSRKTQHS